MSYDYAHRYSPVLRSRQQVAARRYAGTKLGGGFRNTISWVAISAIIMVVGASFIFGLQLKQDQDALMIHKLSHRHLESINQELTVQRDKLLSKKRIEKAANKLGLNFPGTYQVVRL